MAAYTLSDYQTIPNANTYVLPTPVMDIIARLSQIFGTTFSTTTVYTESKPRIQRQQQRPKEEWKTDFKATTIIEKGDKFTDIRTALNKLSPKNYDATSEFILEKVKELIADETFETSTMVTNIIDIMRTSKIAVYPRFYKVLVDTFPIFAQSVDQLQESYMASMSNIKYVDQNSDYNAFCANNKENDRRKATADFITHLAPLGLIPHNKISFMTDVLVDLVHTYMKETDKTGEVDELTENIFILMGALIKSSNVPKDLNDKVLYLSQRKVKELPSISSRAIFKYVDLIERTEEADI
jgi:hypothetical protein